MSERDSGSLFCCCRRSNTSSPQKYVISSESSPQLKEDGFEDVSISVTVPPTEASKSRDDTMWASGSFTSEEKSLDVQQQSEFENGNGPYSSQGKDADTLVLPSRLKSASQAENDVEVTTVNFAASEVLDVDAFMSSGDFLSLSDDKSSSEYLLNFEKLVRRLEAVADQLESEAGAKNKAASVIYSGLEIESENSDVTTTFDQDPPSVVLVNGQWIVANHKRNHEIVLKITEEHQNVNINHCNESTIQIEGNAGSIILSNCIKCGVVFQESSKPLTIEDCQRLQIQVLASVPSINARNTDGLSIYLNRQSQDVPVYSFKCSEVNLLIPLDDGDFKEVSVPEQFQSYWSGKQWVTNVSDILN